MPDNEIRPFIRVQTRKKRLHINLAAHDMLGKPPYLEFFWNDENKMLVIVPVADPHIHCFIVPERNLRSRKFEIILHGMSFVSALMSRMDWRGDMIYKIYGEHLPDYNMIGFPMSEAIITEEAAV